MHLKCLFVKARGSAEQLYDSGAAEMVRLVVEVLVFSLNGALHDFFVADPRDVHAAIACAYNYCEFCRH